MDTLFVGTHTFEKMDWIQIETTPWNNKVWTDSIYDDDVNSNILLHQGRHKMYNFNHFMFFYIEIIPNHNS